MQSATSSLLKGAFADKIVQRAHQLDKLESPQDEKAIGYVQAT